VRHCPACSGNSSAAAPRLREAGIAVLLLCALGLYSRHAAPPAAQVMRTAAGEIREEPCRMVRMSCCHPAAK
jgi:hypothetical protein